jgi:uncharacterized protein (TIRG00374 family)
MNAKRILFLFLKIAVSGALILWLVRKTDVPAILQSLKASDPVFVLLVFGSILMMNLGQVVRWRFLIAGHAAGVRISDLLKYHMVGIFFQCFLPSSMSVELIKAYQLSRITDPKRAYASVVFGKVMGVTLLMFFFIGILALKPDVLREKGVALRVVWGITVFFAVLAVVFSKKVSRALFGRFHALFERPLFRKVKAFREALYDYRYGPGMLVLSGLASIAIFAGSILATYFSFLAVGFRIPLLVCMVYVPIVYVLLMMPVSINGIGLREGLTLLFMAPWGLTPQVLLSSSLIAYAALYSISLSGGLVYIFGNFQGVTRGKEKT